MDEQFNIHSEPIWNCSYAQSLKKIRSISSTDIIDTLYDIFNQGQFLASIHSRGYRYVDYKPDNVGRLPNGAYVIIDPGGMHSSVISATEMVNDFLVPSLYYDGNLFNYFVKGYLYEAKLFIDPFKQNFSTQLMELLGVKLINDQKIDIDTSLDTSIESSEIDENFFNDDKNNKQNELVLFLKFCNLRACFHANIIPNLHNLIKSIFSQKGQTIVLQSELSLADICNLFKIPQWLKMSIKKSNNIYLNVFSRVDGQTIIAEELRPWNANIVEIMKWEDNCEVYKNEFRHALLNSIKSILLTLTRIKNIGVPTFVSFQSIFITLCVNQNFSLLEAEKWNSHSWFILGYFSNWSQISENKVKFSNEEEAVSASLLLDKLFYLDYSYWVHSLKNRGIGVFPTWAAGIRAIRTSNKSLIILMHGLSGFPANYPLTKFLADCIRNFLIFRRYAFYQILKVATECDCLHLLPGAPTKMVEGIEWCAEIENLLNNDNQTCSDFLKAFCEKMEYFCYEEMVVEFPGGVFRHSGQDIFHGIGQTFKNGYER